MLDLRFLVRPMLAAPFIVGGLNVLRTPKTSARAAADVAEPIANAVGLDANSEALVKANAGAQVGAGAALALGILPPSRRPRARCFGGAVDDRRPPILGRT